MEALERVLPTFAATLPDDLLWLAENQGTPYKATTCRTMLRDLRPDAARHQRDLAEVRHGLGTRLIDLITHGALQTFERETLSEFLELDCGIDPEDGCEYIRFAKATTAEEATRYGFTRCRVGAQLVVQLKLSGMKELARQPIAVPLENGGVEEVSFTPDVPVSKLRWALKRLRANAAPPAEPETPSRTTARRLREFSQLVDKYLERYPELGGVRLRAGINGGKARVLHEPLTSNEQFAAVAKLYAELSKVR